MKVSFGPFILDSATRQLAGAGTPVHLSPKAFALLQLLVDRAPAVVSKAEIAARIWPGVSVAEGSLGGVVKEVRRALGDDPACPTYIRTAHTVGYAFIGPVSGIPATPADLVAARCWVVWDDRTITLTAGENLIGRDPRCAVWIDASGVSRRHARIIVVGADEAVIEDLGSRNGTMVGSTMLRGERRLEDGDAIHVGLATLTFRQWTEARAPLTEPLGRGRRTRRGRASSH